nr:MAG TPA: hypothetical protein [Caudoviricetes sp.]
MSKYAGSTGNPGNSNLYLRSCKDICQRKGQNAV